MNQRDDFPGVPSSLGNGERSAKVPGARRGSEELLDQCITPWNGALYSRRYLLLQLKAERRSQAFIDFWVFRPAALSQAQIEVLYANGEIINNVPNEFPFWYSMALKLEGEEHLF
jgi:hypothetical protein